MTDVIITKDCDGHTQRVILKNTPEGVRFGLPVVSDRLGSSRGQLLDR